MKGINSRGIYNSFRPCQYELCNAVFDTYIVLLEIIWLCSSGNHIEAHSITGDTANVIQTVYYFTYIQRKEGIQLHVSMTSSCHLPRPESNVYGFIPDMSSYPVSNGLLPSRSNSVDNFGTLGPFIGRLKLSNRFNVGPGVPLRLFSSILTADAA